ncbi:MAG: alpha/beta fold hydrolase [Deltaproteobacteria bacterium]|nr:alpha/beta fold hydrolase [Deltaproteobacteria bacterium]
MRATRVIRALVLVLTIPLACGGGDDDAGDDDDDAPVDDDDGAGPDDDDEHHEDDDEGPRIPTDDPEAPGPFAAGTSTIILEDSARELFCGDGPRSLMTVVWYPADPAAAGGEELTVRGFFGDRWDEIAAAILDGGGDPDDEFADLPAGAYRDAPHADFYPLGLILFSHGFSANGFQNFTMAAHLASHGYIVAAPDHTCNSRVTLSETGVVEDTIADALVTIFERVDDLSFLIDVFTDPQTYPFAELVDPERIGLVGHSFGGWSVTEAAKADGRVRAFVQLASFGLPAVDPSFDAASMFFYGRQDKYMRPFKGWHNQLIDLVPAPKYEAELFDTGHYAFSDLCRYNLRLQNGGNGCGTETRLNGEGTFTNPDHDDLHRAMNAYITAFFGNAFYDAHAFKTYLAENHFTDLMTYDATAD